MSKSELSLRLSQTIAPFGVGAIYDISGQSFVATDISEWGQRGRAIELDRLRVKLGKNGLRSAPSVSSGEWRKKSRGVPFYRFPRWLFCSRCRYMSFFNDESDRADSPKCDQCSIDLVPMRFIGVCESGHLDDVPWGLWSHSRSTTPAQKQCGNRVLKFLASSGRGGGLQSLTIKCQTCGASRSLEGITQKGTLLRVGWKCPGSQPWRHDRSTSCASEFRVVQRGSSNVHFSITESALDIPPDSDFSQDRETRLRVINHRHFSSLDPDTNLPSEARQGLARRIARDAETTPDLVLRVADQEYRFSESPIPETESIQNLATGEWAALTSDRDDYDDRSSFIAKPVPQEELDQAGGDWIGRDGLIDRLVNLPRLREVRALRGFSRLQYGASEDAMVPVDLGFGLDWIPAVEVFGEGIFIRINESKVANWESSASAEQIEQTAANRVRQQQIGWLPEVSARLIMLHTLSHLIIRRAAFVAGYSLSSIRERLYVSEHTKDQPMAGILIYTASGDSEGSLGGLVGSGDPTAFARVIDSALLEASWCSQDPVCAESASGPGAVNVAACHACALLPETSCQMGNMLLDRRSVVGGDHSVVGFMQTAVEQLVTS